MKEKVSPFTMYLCINSVVRTCSYIRCRCVFMYRRCIRVSTIQFTSAPTCVVKLLLIFGALIGDFYDLILTNTTRFKQDYVLGSTTKRIETISTNEFQKQSGIQTYPFVVNLFVETVHDLGVNVQLDVNHRQVSLAQVAITAYDATGEMPLETLTSDAESNSVYQTFQAKPFHVFPYSIEKTTSPADVLRVQSLSKVDYKDDKGEVHASVDVRVDNRKARQVTDTDLQTLATILQLPENELKKEGRMYTWAAIYSRFQKMTGLGSNVAKLNDMCDAMLFPFRYDPNARTEVCNEHFKSFFSSLHPVRHAIVDGGHRTDMAARVFSGYTLDQQVPLKRPAELATSKLRSNCTICLPVSLCVMGTSNANDPTMGTLQKLKDYSSTTQDCGLANFKHEHKQVFQTIYQDLNPVLMKYGVKKLDKLMDSEFVEKSAECVWSSMANDIIDVVIRTYASTNPGFTEMGRPTPAEVEQIIKSIRKKKTSGRCYLPIPDVSVFHPSESIHYVPMYRQCGSYLLLHAWSLCMHVSTMQFVSAPTCLVIVYSCIYNAVRICSYIRCPSLLTLPPTSFNSLSTGIESKLRLQR